MRGSTVLHNSKWLCAYVIAGGYAYAYVIASGCVISLNAHCSCNTPALSAVFHHIFTSYKIKNTERLLHTCEPLPNIYAFYCLNC